MHNHNLEDWLVEQDIPGFGGGGIPAQPDPAGGQAPMSDPNQGMAPNVQGPGGDPNITNMQQAMPTEEPDISQDPQSPDMPESKNDGDDFEVWKNGFMKEAIAGDVQKMKEMLSDVRDKELLAYQEKFVNDNWNICMIRENSNYATASKQIRKLIKEQLDKNNPATTVVNHITDTIVNDPFLESRYITISGYGGLKGDLHRKHIAALTGSVQVGSGANEEDIIFNENDYSIQMSTRFNAQWGEVMIGPWSLREDDPDRYLSEPELRRLEGGSPEERDVLRRRVVMESIAHAYEDRAFIINVVADDGTIHHFGWDLASSLRGAYSEGKVIVKTRHSDNSEAIIDDDGKIIPMIDLDILYMKETGSVDVDGMPEKEEINFMRRRNGMLFLTADLHTVRESASMLQGAVFKETPYRGNPSDLKELKRCVFSSNDLLMKRC
jgi:hypothetical protein